MKCSACNSKLIWQSDFDAEDYGFEFEGIVSVYLCSNCDNMIDIVMDCETDESFIIEY